MSGTRPGRTPRGPGKAEEGPRRRAPGPFPQSLGTPARGDLIPDLLIVRHRAAGPGRLAIGQLLADLRAVSAVRWGEPPGGTKAVPLALQTAPGPRPPEGAPAQRDEASPMPESAAPESPGCRAVRTGRHGRGQRTRRPETGEDHLASGWQPDPRSAMIGRSRTPPPGPGPRPPWAARPTPSGPRRSSRRSPSTRTGRPRPAIPPLTSAATGWSGSWARAASGGCTWPTTSSCGAGWPSRCRALVNVERGPLLLQGVAGPDPLGRLLVQPGGHRVSRPA
jgi:hypothetical protein